MNSCQNSWERCYSSLRKTTASALCTRGWGVSNPMERSTWLIPSLRGYIYREALAQGYVSHMITIVVKRECFDRIGLFDLDFVVCDDDEFCLRLAKENRLGLVPEALAIIHDDGGEARLISNRVSSFLPNIHDRFRPGYGQG
jgi:GT2 family glycosyltransferase